MEPEKIEKNSAFKSFLKYDDCIISYSGIYNDFKDDIVFLLCEDYEVGSEQGWNSGGFPEQWIKISLNEPEHIEELWLKVNIYPNCTVNYNLEIELKDKSIRKIEKSEFHEAGEVIIIPINSEIRSVKITTTKSEAWVAWSRILLVK